MHGFSYLKHTHSHCRIVTKYESSLYALINIDLRFISIEFQVLIQIFEVSES